MGIETVRRNERRKLSATLCNTMAAGLLTVGAVAPTVALVLRVEDTRAGAVALIVTVVTAVLLAGSLHFCGWQILERLEE